MKTAALSLAFLSSLLFGCAAEICEDGLCEGEGDPNDDPGLVSETIGAARREAVFNAVENGWVRVERWSDSNTGFKVEDYPPDGRGNQEGQRLVFFNSAKPRSNKFLMYYAPGWNTNPNAVPVLLVHGANDSPDRAWANPNFSGGFGCGAAFCPNTALMQHLSQRGYKVFAIGFPHKQGDNYYWAEEIKDAIAIVKARTGAQKVDLVAWSKGVTAARMYVSGVTRSWGTKYQDDVRRLVLLGGPNGGFDYIFRYGWNHNFLIAPACNGKVNAPMPHTSMVCFGLWWDMEEYSIFKTDKGDFFPGQKQMLARWDSVYPVPPTSQDWFTTYYGGLGFFTDGLGIDVAIDQGSLIAPIQASPSPAAVETYLLCGTTPTIPIIPNEISGPSDGVVFIDSCLDDTGITNVAGAELIPVNHLQLGWSTIAMEQVASWLAE